MRLGQLARKLAITPSEIIQFLAENEIQTMDLSNNARIADDHVLLIMNKFAPAMTSEIAAALTADGDEVEVVEQPVAVVSEREPVPKASKEIQTSEVDLEEPAGDSSADVIKAPKVMLSGLKVIGKIELPEPKKKEQPVTEQEEDAVVKDNPPTKRKFEDRKSVNSKRESRSQQQRKNPISQQREREKMEAEEKRKADAERKKEQRTQNYLKKVKASAPTKAMKLIDEQVIEMSERIQDPPKTLIGKFFRWLRS
jgi:hypothetical protein